MNYYLHLMTTSHAAKETRLFGLARYLMPRWRDLFHKFYHQDRSVSARQHLAEFCIQTVQALAATGFYAFVVYRTVVDPRVTIGSLFLLTQAMQYSVQSVAATFSALATLYQSNLYFSNFFEYLMQQPGIRPPAVVHPVPQPIRHGIRFESVHFAYPTGAREVLTDISFEILPGERIAVVGENGSGKTTLVKLLARLYDPQQGRITVDGVDLRQLAPEEWYGQIGIIFQDFVQYWISARENVGFGRLDYVNDFDRIRRAAESGGIAERIGRLEKGWETVLGRLFDEGQELSTGEWQKVALARAFLRDSQILVLDEPTASVDAKHEYELFRRFDEFTRGKTTILISHRLSTVRMADRILVIEDGRLIESGRHDDL